MYEALRLGWTAMITQPSWPWNNWNMELEDLQKGNDS